MFNSVGLSNDARLAAERYSDELSNIRRASSILIDSSLALEERRRPASDVAGDVFGKLTHVSKVADDPAFKKLEASVKLLLGADGRMAQAEEEGFDNIIKAIGAIDQEFIDFKDEMVQFRDFESWTKAFELAQSALDFLNGVAESAVLTAALVKDGEDVVGGVLEITGVGVILKGVLDVVTGVVSGVLDGAAAAENLISQVVEGAKTITLMVKTIQGILKDGITWNALIGQLDVLGVDVSLLDSARGWIDNMLAGAMEKLQAANEDLEEADLLQRIEAPKWEILMRNLTPLDLTGPLSIVKDVLSPIGEKNLLPMHAVFFCYFPIRFADPLTDVVTYVISVGDEKTIKKLASELFTSSGLRVTDLTKLCLNQSMFYAEKWTGQINKSTRAYTSLSVESLVDGKSLSKSRISIPNVRWSEGHVNASAHVVEEAIRAHVREVKSHPKKNKYCLLGPNCQTIANKFASIAQGDHTQNGTVDVHEFRDGGKVVVSHASVGKILDTLKAHVNPTGSSSTAFIHSGQKYVTHRGTSLNWSTWKGYASPKLPEINNGDSLAMFGKGVYTGAYKTLETYHTEVANRFYDTTGPADRAAIDTIRANHASILNRFGYNVVTSSPMADGYEQQLIAEGGVKANLTELRIHNLRSGSGESGVGEQYWA